MENRFEQPYGLLINEKDIELHKHYFEEMVSLIGVKCIFKAPRKDKHYTLEGELKSNYEDGILTGCIFDEHPTPQTLKKIGWVTELAENAALISVPYNLKGLQQGALFIIPDTFNPHVGKVFRVVKMSSIAIYPASITCEIIPEWENTMELSQTNMFKNTDFNILNDESEWSPKRYLHED